VITEQVAADAPAQRRCTSPDTGADSALLIRSDIGDIHRFLDRRHLCSYAGLVPSVHASADKTRLGRLTKQGSSWLRWIWVEVAVHAINGAPQFRSLSYRVAKQHGRHVGRVAVARALLKTISAMLKKQHPFRPIRREQPVSA
jgi:transposase